MGAFRIVPCLDVDRGQVVKGVRFADLRPWGDPVELAARYRDDGADELVFLDISATVEGREALVGVVEKVAEVLDIPFAVGGGVRTVEDAARLLAAGADKVAVNSAAVADPALLTAMAELLGCQSVVLAVDVRRRENGWEVMTHGGRRPTGWDVFDWVREGVRRGAGEILLTSVDRDGTGQGFDEDLLRAVRQAVSVPIVASGGALVPEHFAAAYRAGADAALAAGIFHRREITIVAVKRALAAEGVPVRWEATWNGLT